MTILRYIETSLFQNKLIPDCIAESVSASTYTAELASPGLHHQVAHGSLWLSLTQAGEGVDQQPEISTPQQGEIHQQDPGDSEDCEAHHQQEYWQSFYYRDKRIEIYTVQSLLCFCDKDVKHMQHEF